MKKDLLHLKKNPTLKDFQAYVACMVKERGFEKETVPKFGVRIWGQPPKK